MKYIIEGYKEKNDIRKKLLTMGLTPNTVIEVIRKAPLGDPLEIKVRGYSLTIRQSEFDLLKLQLMCCGCSNKKQRCG
jgi:ferrous iron transport protein A